MQEASLGQEPSPLQAIWEPTAFLGEVKAVGRESFPDASSTFLFPSWKAAALFTRCSTKGFAVLFLFLATRKAGEPLIGASWARAARASLERESEIWLVCEGGEKIIHGKSGEASFPLAAEVGTGQADQGCAGLIPCLLQGLVPAASDSGITKSLPGNVSS